MAGHWARDGSRPVEPAGAGGRRWTRRPRHRSLPMWGSGRRRRRSVCRWLRSPGRSRRARAGRTTARLLSRAGEARGVGSWWSSRDEWFACRTSLGAVRFLQESRASQAWSGYNRATLSRSHARASAREQREAAVEVAVVLASPDRGLVEQPDLGVEVADAVVGHPGHVLERRDVVGHPLVGPQAVAVRRDRQVDDPRRSWALRRTQIWLSGVLRLGELSSSGRSAPP